MAKKCFSLLFVYCTVILTVLHTAECLIRSEPMPRLMKECLKTLERRSSIKRDLSSDLTYMCINKYIMRTSNQRWAPHIDHDIDDTLTRDMNKCKKMMGLDRKNSHRVSYIKRSIRKHFRDIKKRKKRQANRYTRMEYRVMPEEKRNDFHRALKMLFADTSMRPNVFVAICNLHPSRRAPFAHFGPVFFAFHRVLLLFLELKLREKVSTVTLPYWDSTLDAELPYPASSIIFTPQFAGNANGVVNQGSFAGWRHPTVGLLIRNAGNNGRLFRHPTIARIVRLTRTSEFSTPTASSDVNLEMFHGFPHVFVGGILDNLDYSTFDPLFWMHHCFIDYIWERIRENQRRHGVNPDTDYPSSSGGYAADAVLLPFTSLRNRDGYRREWIDYYYRYDRTPGRCRNNRDCKSRYCVCRGGRCVSVSSDGSNHRRKRSVSRQRRRKRHVTNHEIIAKYFPYLRHVFPSASDAANAEPEPEPQTYSSGINTERMVKTSPLYHSVQNSFTINGVEDTRGWSYIPVITYYRSALEVKYDSHPIKNGRVDLNDDIYHTKINPKYRMNNVGKPAKMDKCEHVGSGAFKVHVKSYGLSYTGTFNEFAIVDERQTMSSGVTQIGVKTPQKYNSTLAYITAFDSCGRQCKPKCLIPNTDPPKYKPCSGVIRVTPQIPRMYSNDYGDAHLHVYDYSTVPPLLSNKNVYLIFYCDQEETWPWSEGGYGQG